MTGSRRFLIFLVLVCVTCVVLVQRSMDDTDMSSLQHYNQVKGSEMIPDADTLPSQNPTTPEAMIKTSTRISVTSGKIVHHEYPGHSVIALNKTKHIENKVPVRRLPLAQNQQLVNRNERIQEILKQGSVVQRRATLDPMRSLKSIPIANLDKVQRIFIITYFRAGSSFFGDILQQNWKTFYHFEPLHSMTYNKRINETKIPEVFALFNNILQCNFTEATEYMDWVKKPQNQFLFAHNLFLWVTCHSNPRACFNPGFVNAACVRSPIHVMKVTRLHMRHLRNYLQENPGMNIKVVYLTRDPRGILSSRWSLDWCNGTNCSDSGVLCGEMDEDIRIFNELQQEQPLNFVKVRYEDLSLNPELETQKLFNFLKIPFSPSVKKFLKTHTISSRKADDRNPYSTRRNSSSMVLSWLERFSYKQITDVQSHCGDVLQKLNHSLITSPGQLPFPNGKVKQNIVTHPNPDKVWRFHKNPLARKYLLNRKEYLQNHPNFSNLHKEIFTSNNTNIEIHKSYKVLDNYSAKGSALLLTKEHVL